MEFKIKLKILESQRKLAHKKYLETAITRIHGEIVNHVINENFYLAKLKSKLFQKYNRRLKYISI
jgi:hypothetical protein